MLHVLYHSEGSERADEGLGETPALWAGELADPQHSYKTSKSWIGVHQPATGTQRQCGTGERKQSKGERVNIVMNLSWPVSSQFSLILLQSEGTKNSIFTTHHEPVDMLTIRYQQHKPCGLHSFTDTKQMLHTHRPFPCSPLKNYVFATLVSCKSYPQQWKWMMKNIRHYLCKLGNLLGIRYIVLYMGWSHYATPSVTYVPCYFKWETLVFSSLIPIIYLNIYYVIYNKQTLKHLITNPYHKNIYTNLLFFFSLNPFL